LSNMIFSQFCGCPEHKEGVLLATTQEGASIGWDFYSGEILVWMFYGLEKALKAFVVIS
jgi:hypothetical protein